MVYIAELPREVQEAIGERLEDANIYGGYYDDAMDSKLTDLADTIDLAEYDMYI